MSYLKVLVTGGAGRVGTAVIAGLASSGYAVRVLDRESAHRAPGVADSIVGDRADPPRGVS